MAGGSVKAVIVDSVSAVIAPLLGGKQNEGDISFCESVTPEAAEFTAGPVNSECVFLKDDGGGTVSRKEVTAYARLGMVSPDLSKT